MKSPVMIRLRNPMPVVRRLAIILTLFISLGLVFSGPVFAAVGVNPPAANPNDYAGGNWLGTTAADDYTNDGTVTGYVSMDAGNDLFTNNGTVTGTINGQNWHDQLINNATGQIGTSLVGGNGNDTLINHGTVGVNLWGGNHNDTIENHGNVNQIYGGPGQDNITNTGTVITNLRGQDDNDTIVNSGTTSNIHGGTGDDHITNTGTVSQDILAGTGDDTIINNDTVGQHIYGDLGNDTVTNNGQVTGWITTNEGDDTITNNGSVGLGISGDDGNDTITNNGSVGTSIQGHEGNDTITINGSVGGMVRSHEGDDTITINGRVDGDIACDQDNDWVILKAGASVGGSIRGGVGTNSVTYDNVPDTGAFTLTNFTQVEYIGNNGFSGNQDVSGIVLAVRGTLRMQSGTLNPALMQVAGGTLAGNGQVNSDVVVMLAGSVTPGNSIGAISVNSINLPANTNYNVELSGASSDRLTVATDVVISGANLNLTLLGAPYRTYKYTIIKKDGAGAVNGAFNGLAEGATFTAGGNDFSISYAGGDGNDVVLTALTGNNPPNPSPEPEPEPEPGADPPAAPQVSPDASPNPTGSLNGPALSWPHVDGSNFYRVYRAACPTCPKEQVGRVPGTSFTDESALPGQVYYYWVRTENPGALSDYSDWIPAWRYEQNPGRAGDFNNDGIMDLLWWEPDTNQLRIWFMNHGGVQSVSTPGEGLDIGQWLLVNTGDFNGDGIWDVLWWNPETGEAAVWYLTAQSAASDGWSPSSTPASDITGNVTLSYSGDLNGDGKADLLWRDYNTGQVTIWLMGDDGKPTLNGPPTLAEGMTDGGKPGVADSLEWTVRGLYDMDHDNKADVVWQHGSDGRVVVWRMDGSQALGLNEYQRADAGNWRIAGLGDLNGDGRGDMVWRNDASGAVQTWLMIGGDPAADPGYEQRDISMGDDAAAWQIKAVGDFCDPSCDDVYCKNTDSGAARITKLDGGEFYPSVE